MQGPRGLNKLSAVQPTANLQEIIKYKSCSLGSKMAKTTLSKKSGKTAASGSTASSHTKRVRRIKRDALWEQLERDPLEQSSA